MIKGNGQCKWNGAAKGWHGERSRRREGKKAQAVKRRQTEEILRRGETVIYRDHRRVSKV